MAKIKVYSYAKCSTCRKALKFLKSRGVESDPIDITEQAPTKTELQTMLKNYDGDLRKLFNTSGLVYREMNMKEKLPSLSKQEALSLLSENGRLVKRPFVLSGKQGCVGFKEEEWSQLLL